MLQIRRLNPSITLGLDQCPYPSTIPILKTLVGSDPKINGYIPDPELAPHHCLIECKNDRSIHLSSVGAPFLTVNRQPFHLSPIKVGDILRLGSSDWILELVPTPPLHSPIADSAWCIWISLTAIIQLALIIYFQWLA
ncbi:MAG: FHA domain-containing protein [Verrucomicrobia bacterium]|nr:FHA domain-containing protein [Verrucomicrobiota bacterium]